MASKSSKKLILSHNQTMKFNDFFNNIQQGKDLFDYSGYSDLLFVFDSNSKYKSYFINLDTNKKSFEYSGAYITGYLNCIDLALAAAFILDRENIPVVDRELLHAPSFSKISESAKLAHAGIPIPKSYGGTKMAIIRAIMSEKIKLSFPLILKRADSERGKDNFLIYSKNEIFDFFQEVDDGSVWIMQSYIHNHGFYRVNCFFNDAAYTIFRSLDDRPPEYERHSSHMYKPAGGINAKLLKDNEIPREVIRLAKRATRVINRDFAGVDIVINKNTNKAYVLEVNYNPQLVTINSFRDKRIKSFLDAIKKI